ncbi:MAG TPA: TRAP transporter fused permease subunit [Trueperaceae bacterium]|nr:TRAP transporter fused permease subunit [Trueperaceae bacterium]
MAALLRRITFGVLLIATLYHLYLVIHPFMPWSRSEIPLLDLTQVERAAHVFLLVLAGYLSLVMRKPGRAGIGAWIFAALAFVPLWAFWHLGMPPAVELATTLYWVVAVVPAVLPRAGRPLDLLAALLTVAPFLYLLLQFNALVNRAMLPVPWDLAMSFGLTFLVLGLVYRMLGPVLPSLVLVFLLYNLYGYLVPGVLRSPGFPLDMLLGKLYAETEAGLFGIITGVSLKYLVYFTILGAVISALGFGEIIANIAFLLVGRSPAAPGRATSVMAVMMGWFSGSGAADTLFVSTLNQPLFERAGYDRLIAAGLSSTVGTIAYITPPIMGSIAFVMVELLAIPYINIIVMAIGPMVLLLIAVWAFNEFYVRKANLAPVEPVAGIDRRYMLRYCYVFLPVLLILVMIYLGYSVNLTVTMAVLAFIVLAYLDPSLRPPLPRLFQGLANGFRHLIPIGAAVVAANVIMTMMVLTGLASKVSELLMAVSGQSLAIATILAALFSLVLGMGVPPIATYVLTSALVAPAIQKLAVANGVPAGAAMLATQMFLFYYAVLADITPPVGLSAYAAASVFKTDPIQTGLYAALVAMPKYLIGFTFLLSYTGTALLIVPVVQGLSIGHALLVIVPRFVFALAGIVLLAAAGAGYMTHRLGGWERWLMAAVGLVLLYPATGVNVVALVAGGGLALRDRLRVVPASP